MVREKDSGDSYAELTTAQYTKILLDVIKRIRSQKQRPSIQRIQNMVRVNHHFNLELLETQLEIAVQDGHILKVHNKGDFSYRDPQRAHTLKSRQVTVDNSTNLLKIIIRSMKEMNEPTGCTLKSIEKFIIHGYQVTIDDIEFGRLIRSAMKTGIHEKYIVKDEQLYRLTLKKLTALTSPPIYVRKSGPFKDLAIPEQRQKVKHQVHMIIFSSSIISVIYLLSIKYIMVKFGFILDLKKLISVGKASENMWILFTNCRTK